MKDLIMKAEVHYWIENDGCGSAEVHFTQSLAEAIKAEKEADDESRMCDRTATTQIVTVRSP